MKYLPDPEPIVNALHALLAELTREHPEIADTMPSAVNARAALDLATDPAVHTVPVLEKYGCPDVDLDETLAFVDGMFAALAALRSGELVLDGSRDTETLDRLRAGLTAVGHRLAPRVQGLLDALTNAFYDAGGSHAELAAALDQERSAVAKRSLRRKVSGPGQWEKWALGELSAANRPATEVRPGWILFDANDRRHQVQTVNVYSDGLVEIETNSKGMAFCYRPGETVTVVERPAPFVKATGHVDDPRSGAIHPSELDVTTYTRSRRTRSAPAAS